jgi:uncharacterized membrane protein required for colicin V production
LAFWLKGFNFKRMIAAATQTTHSMALDNLPFGWFDVALVLLLAFGIFRGRRNGMTKEILPMLKWVCIVVVCGLGYELVGQAFANLTGWSEETTYILSYLAIALLFYVLFVFLKNLLMPKLTGSNIFGGAEYYLGMVSGLIRYACILIFALALLNAPFYTPAEIQAHKAYVARWYGGGEKGFSGDYFPTLQTVQEGVFKDSLLGPPIKNCLGALLINTGPADADTQKSAAQPTQIIHIGN